MFDTGGMQSMRTSAEAPHATWISIEKYLCLEVFNQDKQQIHASMLSDRHYLYLFENKLHTTKTPPTPVNGIPVHSGPNTHTIFLLFGLLNSSQL